MQENIEIMTENTILQDDLNLSELDETEVIDVLPDEEEPPSVQYEIS